MCTKLYNSPITIHHLTLKNRIIFAPTSMGLQLEERLSKLRQIAAGGVAMIIIGDVPVLQNNSFSPHPFLSLYDAAGKAYYKAIIDAIHEEGALVCAQLYVSDSDTKKIQQFIPDLKSGKITKEELNELLRQSVADKVTDMPLSEINEIVEAFGKAASEAQKLGFDMIQVHGDQLCGSFSSSIFNKRTDAYGDSAINRARLAVEIVKNIRQAVPEMAIDYKLPVRQENPHYGNGGVLVEELETFVPLLETAGVDSFHVTLANHGKLTDIIPPRNHPYFKEEGCFLAYCDLVRQYTDKPICGIGGLSTPEFIEQSLQAGQIQLAAMCRQLLADPQWVNKANAGLPIIKCVRCNRECLGGMQQRRGVHCIFDTNPHQTTTKF